MNDADLDTLPRWLRPLARVPLPWVLLLAFALMLLRQPYRGVRHDSLLYVGQALSHLDPAWAAHDFFFRHGSQDQFTLFSNVLAALTAHFGIGTPEILILLACQALDLVAVAALTAGWPPVRRALALLAVAALSHFYGSSRIFAAFEPFVTARTFAEPAVLFACAAVVRGRWAWAGVAFALALLSHPLMALPAVVATWLYLVSRDRRWAAALLLAVPIAWLAHAGVHPFDRLAAIYDPDWLAIVATNTPDVFLSEWSIRDATVAVGNALLLWLAVRGVDGPFAALSRCVLAAAVLLCVATFVGADLLHDVLVTQLQLWRVFWLVNVLYVAWLPALLWRLWQLGPTGRVAALTVALVAPVLAEDFPNGWALLAWSLALCVLALRGVTLSPSIRRLMIVAIVAVAIVSCALIGWNLNYQLGMHLHGSATASVWSIPFELATLALPFGVVLLCVLARGGIAGRAGAAAVALLGVVAVLEFDQRDPFARYVEGAYGRPHPFQARIPPDAQVYWEDLELAPIWLMLRRPSYAAAAQFSGLLFNRQTAADALAREGQLGPINAQIQRCTTLEGFFSPGRYHFADCVALPSDFFRFCQGEPHADFLVTRQTYGLPPSDIWRFEPGPGLPPVDYRLYDCRSVRAAASALPAASAAGN